MRMLGDVKDERYDQNMSKYSALWAYVQNNCADKLTLSFDEVQEICGIPIDHAFLQYKKELETHGFKVGKISLKNQTVAFERIADVHE